MKFRDAPVRTEVEEGRVSFELVRNDGSHRSYELLTGLKNIFQKQLPKMPREYITRLVYDTKHDSLAIIRKRPGSTSSAPAGAEWSEEHGLGGSVIGGITYRLFAERTFCEIVFCAISSNEQVKGFGSALMNQLKEEVRRVTNGQVRHYLTYADNYAIGYFKKQGFTRIVTLDRSLWSGYIKDYDGGTLMQCTIVPNVNYLSVYQMLHKQKVNLVKEIDRVTHWAKSYAGLGEEAFPLSDPAKIPGLVEAGWTEEMSRQSAETPRRGRLYEMLRPLLNELQSHHAAWPFLKPVDAEEVPSYYTVITNPMDLSTMDAKLEGDKYGSLPEFIADFNLIISNCRIFNDPDTSYCKNANNLEKFFQDRLRARGNRP